jgi:hypothetical protein
MFVSERFDLPAHVRSFYDERSLIEGLKHINIVLALLDLAKKKSGTQVRALIVEHGRRFTASFYRE